MNKIPQLFSYVLHVTILFFYQSSQQIYVYPRKFLLKEFVNYNGLGR